MLDKHLRSQDPKQWLGTTDVAYYFYFKINLMSKNPSK